VSSFTLVSNSVVLVDGSRTPIQDIDTAATTPTILSSVFYLSCFSFNLLSVGKIIKVLNCTMTFFRLIVYFRSLGQKGNWHRTWAERTIWAKFGIRSGDL